MDVILKEGVLYLQSVNFFKVREWEGIRKDSVQTFLKS